MSTKVEEIKHSSGSCMMDVPGNDMLLCQLTPKLQQRLAWSNSYDLIWKMVSIILHESRNAHVIK